MDQLIEEVVNGLCVLSISELEEFRNDYMDESRRNQVPEVVSDFCGHIIDLVIMKKWEEYIS